MRKLCNSTCCWWLRGSKSPRSKPLPSVRKIGPESPDTCFTAGDDGPVGTAGAAQRDGGADRWKGDGFDEGCDEGDGAELGGLAARQPVALFDQLHVGQLLERSRHRCFGEPGAAGDVGRRGAAVGCSHHTEAASWERAWAVWVDAQ